VLRGPDGERTIAIDGFYVGPYVTTVAFDEILTEVRIATHQGSGSAYEKVERRAGDFAIGAAAASLTIAGGTIEDAGVALSALAPTTIEIKRAEELLRGSRPSEELFAQAGEIAAEDCAPLPDGRGPVDYKRHLAGVLTKRALNRAAARALHQEA
jgi:aerobic carbon-monoxide dehydrogenase medium subunit